MDEILGQLGGLLLGSVPTIIFIVLLYGIYTAVVHRPLVKVLAERHSRTEGAIEKARADIAKAEARTADYEQRLREARMSVFKRQEAHRQQLLQARAATVAEARAKAQTQVEQARAAIETDKLAARASLEAES
jgi:F-type H+-transporting ATPase subunit b